MSTLKEIALRRTRELLSCGQLQRPLRLPREIIQELYDLTHGEKRFMIKHPITKSIYFGSRPTGPTACFGDLLDRLPIDLSRMELTRSNPDEVAYFSSESPIFRDPLVRFNVRRDVPGVLTFRTTILAVRKDDVVNIVQISHANYIIGSPRLIPGHRVYIYFQTTPIGMIRRINALIWYPVKRVRRRPLTMASTI